VNDFLSRIVATTRARLAAEPIDAEDLRVAARQAAGKRPPFAFSSALRNGNGIKVIAEIKSASPSAGTIVENPDVESIAADYARGGASAISVVTEPDFFRGSRDWIARAAAAAANLPVIMKDFVVEPEQLEQGVAAGASAVLLLASLLDVETIARFIALLDEYSCDALVEVHDEAELQRAIAGGARLIGVNNRNLRDFGVDLATSQRLSAQMPKSAIRVAESGIKSRQDVDLLRAAGFHAFLVGESLLRQNDRAAAVRKLVNGVIPSVSEGSGGRAAR
jgi:indole-3-glycerol phosphate synthase